MTRELSVVTHVTAPTRYVDANGIRFAYRRFGQPHGVPLLFLQHFRGGLDHWDPAVTDGLGASRPVILFDNAGVGSSSGEVPATIEAMADRAAEFLRALALDRVDVLGFSIGGYVAQALAVRHPALVRRLILVGTGPAAGEPSNDPGYMQHATHTDPATGESALEDFLYLFFSPSADSQATGRAFWERRHQRKLDVDRPSTPQAMLAQAAAGKAWREATDEHQTYLQQIANPTLVVSGSNDIMIPTSNSITLAKRIPDAQLIIYPDSGHGSLFQYPELFVEHARLFLDAAGTTPDTLGYEIFIADPIPQHVTERVPNGDRRMFSPLSVTLIYGERDAVLVDPPLTIDQATAVGDWVERSGKRLTHIFATHGHGDHWFTAGLLADRFGATVVASAGTIRQMHRNVALREAFWDKLFPGQIPPTPVTAVTPPENRFVLEGHELVIIEVGHSDTDETSVLWVPDLSLVVAGDVIYNGVHQFLSESADGGRDAWRKAIDVVESLDARWIVTGHKNKALDDDARRVIRETRRYLDDADELLRANTTALDFFRAMLDRYPDRLNPGALWGGAKALYPR